MSGLGAGYVRSLEILCSGKVDRGQDDASRF
jgi:hypothetical protein